MVAAWLAVIAAVAMLWQASDCEKSGGRAEWTECAK